MLDCCGLRGLKGVIPEMRPDETLPRLPMMLINTFSLKEGRRLSKKAQFGLRRKHCGGSL
jgi:hypothetical protein